MTAVWDQDRTGISAAPMQAVSAKLAISDMIAVAAYAADQDAEPH